MPLTAALHIGHRLSHLGRGLGALRRIAYCQDHPDPRAATVTMQTLSFITASMKNNLRSQPKVDKNARKPPR